MEQWVGRVQKISPAYTQTLSVFGFQYRLFLNVKIMKNDVLFSKSLDIDNRNIARICDIFILSKYNLTAKFWASYDVIKTALFLVNFEFGNNVLWYCYWFLASW